jgi:hypothetical protein
MLLVEV